MMRIQISTFTQLQLSKLSLRDEKGQTVTATPRTMTSIKISLSAQLQLCKLGLDERQERGQTTSSTSRTTTKRTGEISLQLELARLLFLIITLIIPVLIFVKISGIME